MARKKNRTPISDPHDPQGWHVMSETFLEWLGVQNYSKDTIEHQRERLYPFAQWAQERGLHQPMQITNALIERYQRYLFYYRKKDGQSLSNHAVVGRLSVLRSFFKWAARKNHILYNPASEIELPRAEKRLPKHILSAAEVETIMVQCNLDDPLGIRDRAMLETLYSTGMRRIELAHLKLRDLDNERGTVTIRQGKGKKDRVVSIGDRAIAWINRYLEEVRPSLVREPDEGILFLTHRSQPFHLDRLSAVVRGYIDAANLGKRGSCHLLRHACATLMLEGGADIRFIQALLGHADLSTTEVYTQVSIRKLKEIHTATHPARLKRSTL
jgi:integrase/recombinase XerD